MPRALTPAMYTGLVCLILFDARGTGEGGVWDGYYWAATAALLLLLLGLKHVPAIFHRPRQVDSLCEDLLHLSVHASCVAALPPGHGHLRYACALHGTFFLLQGRILLPSAATSLTAHAVMLMWLLYAHAYGPRVTEIQTFIGAVASPHTLDLVARAVVQLHRLATLCLMEW
jgi:hypothetical protein